MDLLRRFVHEPSARTRVVAPIQDVAQPCFRAFLVLIRLSTLVYPYRAWYVENRPSLLGISLCPKVLPYTAWCPKVSDQMVRLTTVSTRKTRLDGG